jgi:hypothetical protein
MTWRRVAYVALGAAWVVGVYVGATYLPAGVHHFFRPDYCYQHEGDEGWTTSCSPEWKRYLALAVWIGLSIAPFVIAHYWRKRHR